MYNPAVTLEALACDLCSGKGFTQEFMTIDQLYQLLAPAIWEGFVKQLPDIIERAQLAVVQMIMDC